MTGETKREAEGLCIQMCIDLADTPKMARQKNKGQVPTFIHLIKGGWSLVWICGQIEAGHTQAVGQAVIVLYLGGLAQA